VIASKKGVAQQGKQRTHEQQRRGSTASRPARATACITSLTSKQRSDRRPGTSARLLRGQWLCVCVCRVKPCVQGESEGIKVIQIVFQAVC
jgi:hypothetical protein